MLMSHPRISARIGAISESATLAVDAKAKALRAEGRPVIGFGAGQPDFPTPGYIAEAAARACLDPKNHRYTATSGLPELREAIAAKTARDSAYHAEPGQVLVTNGAKHAVYEAFATLVDPGDEVLVPSPYWTTYPECIALAGGTPVPVLTDERSGYLTSVAGLEAARTERTKLLLFVSPSNPTGAVYPPDLVAEIGRWAAANGLWVVTDEIYEHLVYGDARFVSMPVVAPEIADRCVVLNGVAKTYAMTGWRVGWMIGPADVIKAAGNLQSHATSNVCNVAQQAALAGPLGQSHGPLADQRGGQLDPVRAGQFHQRRVPHRPGHMQVQMRLRQRAQRPFHRPSVHRRAPRRANAGSRRRVRPMINSTLRALARHKPGNPVAIWSQCRKSGSDHGSRPGSCCFAWLALACWPA